MTFDAMETLERHSDSIDKLTLIVSKMNVKMDKRGTPWKPRVYQGRPRGQSRNRQQTFQPHNRSFSKDKNRNRGNYNNRNNYRSNYRDRSKTITDVTIGETTAALMKDEAVIGKTIGEIVTGKIRETDKVIERMTPNKGTEIGSESRDRSRNYSGDNSRSRDRNRDRQI